MKSISWAAKGDLNAFFALMLDNMLNMVVFTAILVGFGYPVEYIYKLMIPGTAFGVLFGDLIYSFMAMRGGSGKTAMPLGLDTPSTIGISVVVLGPVWLQTKDPILTWQVGMATMVLMGIVKIIFSFLGESIRKIVPAAGLIGSLAGVGLALLAFLPLFNVFSAPIVGLIAFGLVLYSLVANLRLPFGLPGAFAAVAFGTILWHLLGHFNLLTAAYHAPSLELKYGFPVPNLGFLSGFQMALSYLPVAIPFGLLTIVGGINNTESARLAGDNFNTRNILLTEAFATLLAGICGGVIQSTPYIGHPAYKKMGAKSAYTLATGLFIGIGGCLGIVQFIVDLLPAAAVTPILIFIGLIILNQGYFACPREHASAVGIALLPCVAELVRIVVTGTLQVKAEMLSPAAVQSLKIIQLLGSGFIITAMLWGAAVAHLIDGKVKQSAIYFLICALLSSFGLIHSMSPTGGLYFPTLNNLTLAYILLAGLLLFLGYSSSEFARGRRVEKQ